MTANTNNIITDGELIRTRRCRHGLMSYFKNDTYVGRCLDTYGEFSEAEISLFKELIQKGDVVVEVGANIGAHTLFLANAVAPHGRVIAIEPQRRIFQLLCANLAINEIANVFTHQMALGKQAGNLVLPEIDFRATDNFGGFSLPAVNGETAAQNTDTEQLSIAVKTLDSFNLQTLKFLKIDVEGMECEVLQGSAATIARLRPILYLENDRPDKSKDLISLVFEMGYDAWWHFPTMVSPDNYDNNKHNIFEGIIYRSSNMLCIPKEHGTTIDNFPRVASRDDFYDNYPELIHGVY